MLAPALLGSIIGAQIAIDIRGDTFNKLLAIIMVVVVVYMILNSKKKLTSSIENIKGKHLWLSIFLFFFVCIYGGFIQTGISFIIRCPIL